MLVCNIIKFILFMYIMKNMLPLFVMITSMLTTIINTAQIVLIIMINHNAKQQQ